MCIKIVNGGKSQKSKIIIKIKVSIQNETWSMSRIKSASISKNRASFSSVTSRLQLSTTA